jgi:hypothetical protein
MLNHDRSEPQITARQKNSRLFVWTRRSFESMRRQQDIDMQVPLGPDMNP